MQFGNGAALLWCLSSLQVWERAHTMEIIRIAIKRKRMWNYWVSMCVMVVVVAVAWWNMSTKTISATRWFFMVPTGKILRSSLLFVLCFFFSCSHSCYVSLSLLTRSFQDIFFVYNFTNRINVCVCMCGERTWSFFFVFLLYGSLWFLLQSIFCELIVLLVVFSLLFWIL